LPFQSLTKSLKKNFKKILNNIKYGDDYRLPLVYLETYSSKPSYYYTLPEDSIDEPFSSFQSFPKLSREILLSLFGAIGVRYVPEVALYDLESKTPQKAFKDFCITFGVDDDGVINSFVLNQIIGRLIEMDKLRKETPFDSRPIYKALAYQELEEADRLIGEMEQMKNENRRID